MQGDPNCVFCKIVAGQIPSYRFWENDNAVAFLDIRPKVNGHTLVIPKRHHPYIFDMEANDYQSLLDASRTVARGLKGYLGKERICVEIEGFDVPHVHIKLVPADDGSDLANHQVDGVPDELDKLRNELKEYFSSL